MERQVEIAIKEYEALRKGIDERADITKNYGWPVILLAFGAVIGFKADLVDVDSALAFIPVVGMTIAALDVNASHDIAKARIAISLVEDRIFILSGLPLLCHESMQVSDWKRKANNQLTKAIVFPSLYLLLQALVSLTLLPGGGHVSLGRSILFVGLIITPAIIYFYSLFMVYRIFRVPFHTRLLTYIAESAGRGSDEGGLLYNTGIEPGPS
jgi:hypothetical protein